MAKIKQGILGALSGKIGGVVGAVWMGIPYIRTMPASVANPQTASQMAQRGKFSSVVHVARLLLSDLVQTYWDPFARYMSGYNSFIKQNIDAFDTSGLLTPTDFSASRGTLTGVLNLSIVSEEASSLITFTFDDNSGVGDALVSDIAMFVWYNVTQDYWSTFMSGGDGRDASPLARSDARIALNDVIECYMFFIRPDVSKICDSSHVQSVVIA